MSTISEKQVQDILDEIKEYQQMREESNKGIGLLLWNPDISIRLGSNLVDSLLEMLEVLFNDDIALFEWYVLESEFGKNGNTKVVNGKEIEIDSAKAIIEILNDKNARLRDSEAMRRAYEKREPKEKEQNEIH